LLLAKNLPIAFEIASPQYEYLFFQIKQYSRLRKVI
jgi:hypothetical protein